MIPLLQYYLRHFIFGHRSRQLFRQGLKKVLNQELEENTTYLHSDIKHRAKQIEKENQEFVKDDSSSGHIEFVAEVMASYQVLLEYTEDKDRALSLLKQGAMKGFSVPSIVIPFRVLLYLCRHRADRVQTIFGWMMAQYGTTFTWSKPVRIDAEYQVYSINITRCFYYELFKTHDMAFLTPILCRLDAIWFEMVNESTHGFSFRKDEYQTMGYGAEECRFPLAQLKQQLKASNP